MAASTLTPGPLPGSEFLSESLFQMGSLGSTAGNIGSYLLPCSDNTDFSHMTGHSSCTTSLRNVLPVSLLLDSPANPYLLSIAGTALPDPDIACELDGLLSPELYIPSQVLTHEGLSSICDSHSTPVSVSSCFDKSTDVDTPRDPTSCNSPNTTKSLSPTVTEGMPYMGNLLMRAATMALKFNAGSNISNPSTSEHLAARRDGLAGGASEGVTVYREKRQRNNESARRCRIRKKESERGIQKENERLMEENSALLVRCESLREQLEDMKKLLASRLH